MKGKLKFSRHHKHKHLKINKRKGHKHMTILELATALVKAVTDGVAAGNTSFVVSAKPDNTAVVLTSSVSSPSTKVEEFAVTDVTEPV